VRWWRSFVSFGALSLLVPSSTLGGTITGVVRRASDGAGLPNFAVRVYDASTSLVTTVGTDEGGAYSVTGLPSGTYFAHVAPFDFTRLDLMPELFDGLPCPPRAPTDCRIASGTPIFVTAGATTSGIDFSLDPASTISGTVVAADTGAPLSRRVAAYAADVEVAFAQTNASGQYTLAGLAPGLYRVRASIPFAPFDKYVDTWYKDVCVGCAGTPSAVIVPPSANVTGIDFSLAAGGTISGTVTCEIGPRDFVAPPGVFAYSASGTLVRPASLGPQLGLPPPGGTRFDCTAHTFTIAGLPTGQYYLLARDRPFAGANLFPPGGMLIDELYNDITCVAADCDVTKGIPVPVTAGLVTSGIDLSLAVGASISVPVQASDPSAPEPPLAIFDARGVSLPDAVLQTAPGPSDAFVGLPPGTYYVKIGDTLYNGIACRDCPPTSGTPVVVPATTAIMPSAAPPAVRRMSGIVSDASSLAPLSTITVELVTGTGRVVGSALSTLFGTYTIDAVEPGTYFARTRNDRGYVDELYSERTCGTCDARTGTPIAVASSDVSDIDFTLAAGGVIAGATGDATGFAVGNVPVSLFDAGGTLRDHTVADATGRYSFNVPAGTYRARAEATKTHGAELYSELPCTSAACNPASGTAINVSTGATIGGINFTLPTCSAMKLSPVSLATGVNGHPYRQVLSVTGGVMPYAFDVADGVLPLGMTLDRTSGVLAGVPASTGRHEFRVSALDINGCSTENAYTLDVQGCAFTLVPSSATLPASGGSISVLINNTCGSQEVTQAAPFVHVQSNTEGQVVLLVDPNSMTAPRTTTVTIGRRVFTVRQAGTGSQPPFGWVDTPLDGQQVSGSIAVSGWALDDLEVRRVLIYRDAVSPEAPGIVFVGTAVFIAGARPDVQRAYPTYPLSDRAGWGFLVLTNTLPNQGNGGFRIHAYAEDVEGHITLLASRQIFGRNATSVLPFGTIDTPGQGDTIAGSAYLNWGWALTPQPAMIPFDGSTIGVIVDGAPIGTLTYNLFRQDVSGLFPGLANSNGPVGYRLMDTTGLTEGLHTISWVVTDDHGGTSGVGSRFFAVANSADAQPLQGQESFTSAPVTSQRAMKTIEDTPREEAAKPLGVPAAPDIDHRAATLETAPVSQAQVAAERDTSSTRLVHAGADGRRAMTVAPMERLVLSLHDLEPESACPATWAGYLIESGVLGDLPVGASLDPAGIFYWQIGPGFAGRFDLLFVRTDCRAAKQRLPVTVTVRMP
jgi:Putative Ig domain/Carboxypeptidase regulatory-like domain